MAGAAKGGAETAFADGCIALAEHGVTVEAVTRGNNATRISRLRAAGIRVHILPFGGWLDFITPWLIRKIIRSFKPDIVQTWMTRAAQKTPPWQASDRKIPRYLLFARFGGYYKLRSYKGTEYFITLTPDIRNWIIKQGIAPERIRQIANFAETEKESVAVDRALENTPSGAPLLVALGRLHRVKAYDILLDAMALLPDAYLWIAGEGPERSALETQIRALGLQDRVRLLGWRDDRAALLKAADLCVFPSRYEPFGTVFIQAWAQRTPLVITASEGPRQYVRDGEDSLVVPVDDVSALGAALRRMIDDPDLRQRLTEKGYERYIEEFSRDNIIANYMIFYEEATKNLK